MEIENRALVLDMIEWISDGPRPYKDVMDAWRTSCPRLTVWEDAVDHGFVARRNTDAHVAVTDKGMALLRNEGRR